LFEQTSSATGFGAAIGMEDGDLSGAAGTPIPVLA
jgi:hypothetical protein